MLFDLSRSQPHSRAPRALVAMLAAAALVVAAAPAAVVAQPKPGVSEQNRRKAELINLEAQALYDARNFAAAIIKWKEAYALFPDPNIAWNLARSHEELGELFKAKAAFELYAQQTGITEQERNDARAKITALEGRIKVLLDEEAALKKRAQKAYDQGDMRAAIGLWREAIDKRVTPESWWGIARAYESMTRFGDAREALVTYINLPNLLPRDKARGEAKLAALDKKMKTGAQPTPDTGGPGASKTPKGSAPGAGLRIAGWSLVGVSALSFGTAGLLRVLASDDVDAVADAGVDPTVTDAEYNALVDEVESAQTSILISLGAGVLTGAAGGVLLYMGYTQPNAEADAAGAQLWIGPTHIGVQGRF